jgi:hypothetical protein
MNALYVCKQCWAIASPREEAGGSQFVEKLLWFLLIVPGAVYTTWRRMNKVKVCPHCSSREIVLMNSPKGIRFMKEMYSNRNTRFVHKVLDYTEQDFIRPGFGKSDPPNQGVMQ